MKSHKIDSFLRDLGWIWLVLFYFVSIIFLYLKTFSLPATPFLTFGDEDHYFIHALRMLHGQVPYRDFFTFIFPGTDLLYAGLFRIFGVHQWAVQGILFLLGILLCWAVLSVSTSLLRQSSAILAGLLFLVFDFNSALDATHHWWSTLFVMIAAGLLLCGRSHMRILACGISCGIATLFTQMHGGLSLIAFALYLAWTNCEDEESTHLLRELLLLCVPFATILSIVVGYYVRLAGLSTVAYWTMYFPAVLFCRLKGNNTTIFFQRPPMHSAGDLASLIPYLFIHAIIPLIYGLCLVRLFKERKRMGQREWRNIFLLNLIGIALFASIVSAPTFLRLCVVSPPAVILGVWFCDQDAELYRWMRIALWIATIGSLVYLPIARQVRKHARIDLPTGRVVLANNRQCEKVWWLAQHTHPGETFFNDPTMAFSLSLESPGPLDFVTASEFTRPQQVDDLLLSMTAHGTRYIFLYPELTEPALPPGNLESFRRYVAMNYHPVKAVAGGEIWQRNGIVSGDPKAPVNDTASDRCVES